MNISGIYFAPMELKAKGWIVAIKRSARWALMAVKGEG
jgi:hypothetical protein